MQIETPEALQALSDTCTAVEALGALGRELCIAVEANDLCRVYAIVNHSRAVRDTILRLQPFLNRASPPASAESLALLQRLHAASGSAVLAEQMLRAWFERELPCNAELRATSNGAIAVADRLLGPFWNHDRDAVFLIGDCGDIVHALHNFEQQRIIVYRPPPGAALPAGTTVARTAEQLNAAICAFALDLPERAEIMFADDELSDNEKEAVTEQINTSFTALINNAHRSQDKPTLRSMPPVEGKPFHSDVAALRDALLYRAGHSIPRPATA